MAAEETMMCALCNKELDPKDANLWELECSARAACPGGAYHEDCCTDFILKYLRRAGRCGQQERMSIRMFSGYNCPHARNDQHPCPGTIKGGTKRIILKKPAAPLVVVPAPVPKAPKPKPPLPKAPKPTQPAGGQKPQATFTVTRVALPAPAPPNKLEIDPADVQREIPGMDDPPQKVKKNAQLNTRALAAQLRAEAGAKANKGGAAIAKAATGAKSQAQGAAGLQSVRSEAKGALGYSSGNVYSLLEADSQQSDDSSGGEAVAWAGTGDTGDLATFDSGAADDAQAVMGTLSPALQAYAAYLPPPCMELHDTDPVTFASLLMTVCPDQTPFEFFAIGNLNVAVDPNVAASVQYDSAALLTNAAFYFEGDRDGAPVYIGSGMDARLLEQMGLAPSANGALATAACEQPMDLSQWADVVPQQEPSFHETLAPVPATAPLAAVPTLPAVPLDVQLQAAGSVAATQALAPTAAVEHAYSGAVLPSAALMPEPQAVGAAARCMVALSPFVAQSPACMPVPYAPAVVDEDDGDDADELFALLTGSSATASAPAPPTGGQIPMPVSFAQGHYY